MSAIDLLTKSDENGNWPHRFVLRGREFIMMPSAVSTHGDGWAQFRVWNDKGQQTDVRVREHDKVTLLSHYSIVGNTEHRIKNPEAVHENS